MDKPQAVGSLMEQSTNAFTTNVPTVVTGDSNTVLPDLLSAMDKPVSSSMEQSMNAFTANAPTVTGNSNTVMLPDLLTATDKLVSLSMDSERSTDAFAANVPTATGNSNMSGGVGGKKPTKMRPGNTSTPRYFTIRSEFVY